MTHGLTYFVELDGRSLRQLLERPAVLPLLQQSGAALAVALGDLSPDRAWALQACSARGIPLTAWLVLERAAGYWLTVDNAALAQQRYREVSRWAADQGVRFQAVGLDLEPPHADALALVEQGQRALLRLVQSRRSRRCLQQARAQYQQLVAEIRGDGLRVETYQLPVIIDERLVGSTLLQRSLGIVDLQVDREVLMLYESLLPARVSAALVDVYGPAAQAIAVGITGGGVDFILRAIGGRRLTFATLLRSLRRAARYTPQRYVFSLEGCVEAGYLEALCAAELDFPVARSGLRPLGLIARRGLRGLLRAGSLAERLADGWRTSKD